MKLTLIVMFLVVLAGCATAPSGDKFSVLKAAPEDKGLLYIYRPDVYYGSVITYPVLLNDNKIADIGNKGFFTLELDPGFYAIRPDTDSIDHDYSVAVLPGEIKFLELYTNVKPALCFCTTLQFREVDESTALKALARAREEVKRVYIK